MKRTIKILLCFLLALIVQSTRATIFGYWYDGNDYEITISMERLHKCPDWDPSKEENPPLSARKALEKGQTFISRFPAKNGNFWEFEGISLVEIKGSGFAPAFPIREGWVWRARYQLRPPGGGTGFWPTIDCYILMDGTVVEPKVTPHKGP
jgi:hypothetical protein